jgi:dTDP-glucose 4,6-dehydratase/UDP-glucuronate decarboxylase
MGRNQKSDKRILVAGGCGFVGSNLIRRLLADGHTVDCVDNLITGRAENIADLGGSRLCFIQGDITNRHLTAALLKQRYTEVYNLACPTGVPNIAILGEEMLMSSSVGTLNLLKVAQHSQARYLFTSTAEAYGDPEVFPQGEDYVGNVDPVGRRSPYEEGKRFGESLTAYYARRYDVETRIVRIFNTYGPAMSPDDQRIVPQLLLKIARGEPVRIYGDGRQTRTFLYVDDLIAGLLCAMHKGAAGEVYNVGGEHEMTILDVVEMAQSAVGRRVELMFEPHFIEDHRRRQPNTAKVRSLGWTPRTSMPEGLRLSYAAMVETLGLPRVDVRASEATDAAKVRQLADAPNGWRVPGVPLTWPARP